MAKILLVNVSASGHLNPTLPVAAELVTRGEEVTYAAPFSVEAAVRATGAAFFGYESAFGKGVAPARGAAFPLAAILPRLVDEVEQAMPTLLDRSLELRPDAIVFDSMALAGWFLAGALKLRTARFCASYAGNDRWSMMTVMRDRGIAFDPSLLGEITPRLAGLAQRYDVDVSQGPMLLGRAADLNISFMPRAFQPEGDTFDDRFFFTGPSIKDRPATDDFPLHELDESPLPILLISLGTVFNDWPEFFDMCFSAFGGAPWRVVLATGTRVDPSIMARAPSNFIARAHVPQLEVLKRAKAFVTHGGMNSTMEALSFGVPLVVVPQMMEQSVTAGRVQEMGLGVALQNEEVTPSVLAAAVARISTESSFAEEVAKMRVHIREAGGYPRAAQAIMDFARAKR